MVGNHHFHPLKTGGLAFEFEVMVWLVVLGRARIDSKGKIPRGTGSPVDGSATEIQRK